VTKGSSSLLDKPKKERKKKLKNKKLKNKNLLGTKDNLD